MVTYDVLKGDALLTQTYTISANGVIKVTNDFEALKREHKLLLRIGNDLEVPKNFGDFKWYGRGPWESYANCKYSAQVGIYKGLVKDQYYPYIRPQESGNKTEVRWAELLDKKGKGIRIDFQKNLLNVSALPYSWKQLYPSSEKGQEHSELLEEDSVIHLRIDDRQMGVAGIDSWYSLPLEKYRIPFQNYSYSYMLTPIN